MTRRYRVLPAADRDLDEHAAYLAEVASFDTALRFYDAAATSFGRLARTPGVGERWVSPKPGLEELRVGRIRGFEKYLIFYRPADDDIEIIRVLHGARDIESEIESEDAL